MPSCDSPTDGLWCYHLAQTSSRWKHSRLAYIQKLTTIQRLAMKATLGCYRTTFTAAMEIESNLPPTWISKLRLFSQSLACKSLSSHHPIQAWLADALRSRTAAIKHRSIPGNIINQFPFTTKIESIDPYIRPPWWTLQLRVQVAANKELAKDLHDKLPSHISDNAMVICTAQSSVP